MQLIGFNVFLEFAGEKSAHLGVNALDVGCQSEQRRKHEHNDGKQYGHRVDLEVRPLTRAFLLELRVTLILAGLRADERFEAVGADLAWARSVSESGSRSCARNRRSSRAICPESPSWSCPAR